MVTVTASALPAGAPSSVEETDPLQTAMTQAGGGSWGALRTPEGQPERVREDFLEAGVWELRPGGSEGVSLAERKGDCVEVRRYGKVQPVLRGSCPEQCTLDVGTRSLDPVFLSQAL